MLRLAGQRADDVLEAMRDFRAGRRIGYGAAMTSELSRLSDSHLQDLACFLSRVAPNPGRPGAPRQPRTR
jgi:cytochrome c553